VRVVIRLSDAEYEPLSNDDMTVFKHDWEIPYGILDDPAPAILSVVFAFVLAERPPFFPEPNTDIL
jgi:hypothetical protein